MTSDNVKLAFKDRSIMIREAGVLPPKTNMQLHWYENLRTGEKVLLKPVIKTKE
jgi:hypothetical protein